MMWWPVAVMFAAAGLPADCTVELSLGVLHSFNEDLYTITGIIVADLDYRKNFEPDLVARFGPPLLGPIPNKSFHSALRVRPVMAEDGGQDSIGAAAMNDFIFGMNGYPKVNGLMGPFKSAVALATAPLSAAYQLNQISVIGATTEALSDKTRFPYFFRTNTPGSHQGHIVWQYVSYFGFRSVTVVCVLHETPQAILQGMLEMAALAHRSEAFKSGTVPNTDTDLAADHAEWDNAVAFVKAAHNRLVILLAPETMAATFLRYLPTHGICKPYYQLLMTNVVNTGNWPNAMDTLHIIQDVTYIESAFWNYVTMYLKVNTTDILAGMERYGMDKWFNKSRVSEVIMGDVVNWGAMGLSTIWFTTFHVFVRAFGELLNEGVAPADIGGKILRAKLAQTDLYGIIMRARFDGSQDGLTDFTFSSVSAYDPPIMLNGVLTTYNTERMVTCHVVKAANGSTLFQMEPVAPRRWANEEVSATAPASLKGCPPGQYLLLEGVTPPGLCIDCPDGSITNSTDQANCMKCPAGTRGDESHTTCVPCPAGEYNPDKGSKACLACMSGSVSSTNGSESCELCPRGTYANTPRNGGTACLPCADGLTTLHVASLDADACVCAAGTYRPLGGGPCVRCGTGLVCPDGGEEANIPGWGNNSDSGGPFPHAAPTYYTRTDAPLDVYLCTSDVYCPGGPPGTCGPNHQSLACGDCMKRFYRAPSGKCEACAASNAVPLTLAIILAVVCLICLAIYSQQEEGGSRQTLVTAVLVAGQLVACVQALSVIQQVKITWVQPLTTVWQITGFVSFDMDLLKVACVLGQDRPVNNFVMQLIGIPVLAAVLGFLMVMITLVRRRLNKGGRNLSWDRYLNLLGLLVVMVYISITVAMLRPLICKRHPNGRHSVASRMAVLCWESVEHRTLVSLSAIGVLLYPVSLLATVAWATVMYPFKAATGSLGHLSRFKFIFARFTPNCYFWGFWYLLRNLCIALVPVAVPDSGVWQMMLLCIFFLPFMAMEAMLLPWRTMLANLSEVVTLVCVLLFLQAAGFLVGASSGGSPELVSYLLLGIILFIMAAAISVLSYALVRTLLPGMQYSIFLCHHKDGAGSLARWLKMQVATVSRAAVFLDSDQLEELDLIVDTVRCRTKNLLVLLTRLTLSRIWCAAEIASAVVNRVPIVPLACCDYQPYAQEQLEKLGDTWSELQKHSVAQYGIHLEHILKAYEHLNGIKAVELRRFSPVEEQRVAAFRAFSLCGVCGPTPPPRADLTPPTRICVAGASGDAEARTTCEVLRHMVQVKTEVPVVAVHSWQEAQPHAWGTPYLLVVLTRGLMQDILFTEVGLEFDTADRSSPVEIVTALADTSFAFPAAEVFEAMEKQGGDEERLSKFLRRVFNILALPVSPHGSAAIMDAQVGELCRRFKDPKQVQQHHMRPEGSHDSNEAAGPRAPRWRPAASPRSSDPGASPRALLEPADPAAVAEPPPILRMHAAEAQQTSAEASAAKSEFVPRDALCAESELVTANI